MTSRPKHEHVLHRWALEIGTFRPWKPLETWNVRAVPETLATEQHVKLGKDRYSFIRAGRAPGNANILAVLRTEASAGGRASELAGVGSETKRRRDLPESIRAQSRALGMRCTGKSASQQMAMEK